jgi:Ion channel
MNDSRASRRRLRERYGLLLGAILAAFFIQGVASPGSVEQVFVTVLLAATLLLALRAADAGPMFVRPAVAVTILLVVASIVESATGNVDGAASRIANLLLVVLAPPAIVVGVVRSLRSRNQVTIEAVFGVLCMYLLLGMFFAFIYGTIDRFNPHFFANGAEATVARCLYFSFTTLTTVGYGDYTAASNLGHTLSVTEGLIGQIYLVTIVSLLVGNLRRRQ